MGYVNDNLQPGEQVVLKASVNPVSVLTSLAWMVFFCVVTFMFMGNTDISTDRHSSSEERANAVVSMSFLGFCLFPLVIAASVQTLVAVTTYYTTEFAVTDRRVIATKGIPRRSIELLHSQVERIEVKQPWPSGKLFNFGTLTVFGREGTKQSFPFITSPNEFKERTAAQISASTGV
jgi:hypothetical protein